MTQLIMQTNRLFATLLSIIAAKAIISLTTLSSAAMNACNALLRKGGGYSESILMPDGWGIDVWFLIEALLAG